MRFARHTKLKKGKLDITPLVDVVLLLLIFFMLTSNMVNQPGFKINLPATTASLPAPAQPVIVTLNQDGDIYVAGKSVSPQNLGAELRHHLSAGEGADLVIQADRKVFHGQVVDIMTQAQEAGWESLAVMARPKAAAQD